MLNASRTSSGHGFTLVIADNGSLWAWGMFGALRFGQIGDGTTESRTTPVRIGTHSDWVSVSAGYRHSMGIRADGSLWGWGGNHFGQLGDGTTTNRHTPVHIGTHSDWVSISAGGCTSLGIRSGGTLWAWGNNEFGQLGDGTRTVRHKPGRVGSYSDWVGASIRGSHVLGIRSDGSLWAWGDNLNGQIGDGLRGTVRDEPIRVGTERSWDNALAGVYISFAICANGGLWAWGANGWGAGGNGVGTFGDGTMTSSPIPVRIGTHSDWVSISTQGMAQHSLGIRADGSLWAWGNNFFGGLGNGTTIDRRTPVRIGTHSDWVGISAGLRNSVGIRADGSVWVWGGNYLGQLGDGTINDSHIPIRITLN